MSDHEPYLPDVGVAENAPDSDSEYFDMISGVKPKPKQQAYRPIDDKLLDEIERELQPVSVEGLGFEDRVSTAWRDKGSCVFCDYEKSNRFELQLHMREHVELKEFQRAKSRKKSRLQSLHERKAQIADSQARLAAESRNIDREIRQFDVAGMREQERLNNRILDLLWS